MAKAKTIDRLEYTRQRFRRLQDSQETQDSQEAPAQTQQAGFIICPVCGEKLIHEVGCLRCFCGWSKC